MLTIFTSIMKGLKVYPENMRRNVELTQGVIFSQRVLLALIEKGLTREEAYKMVQDNAMKAWKKRKSFLNLLEADRRITAHLSKKELNSLFDYNCYLRYVDTVFKRLKLNKSRGGKKSNKTDPAELAPRAV
jgi:adenylosuccinate lyase